jgi:GT2 family glycosyltransferase
MGLTSDAQPLLGRVRKQFEESVHMNGPTVSIIIVAWNSREAVLRCLRSLEALGKLPFSLETVVVDNFSDDGTLQALMIETDTIAMSQDSFSILAAEMVNHDGSLQRVVVRRFPTVARIFFGFSVLGSGVDLYLLRSFFTDDYTYARTRFVEPVTSVDQPGASFLLLSRDAIDRMGGIFSAEFPIWWNDVDLAKRAERAGIMRGIMPGVRIPHELGHSAKKLPRPTRRYIFCQSMVRYCRKWKMHPRLIQSLFVIDGLLNIVGGWPMWSAQIGLSRGTRECWAYGISQIRGILTA